MNFKKLRFILFPLLLAVIITVLIYLIASGYFTSFFRNTENIAQWIEGRGIISWLAFIGIQILQVIIFVIPGEFTQIAGGYIFGVFLGGILTLTGITIGSVCNFYIARFSGADFIRKLIKEDKYNKFQEILSRDSSIFLLFILFLIPGIPKDIVCYFAGLSRISAARFLLLSTLGRIPGIVFSVIIGAALMQNRMELVLLFAVLSVLFFIIGLLLRKKFIKVKV